MMQSLLIDAGDLFLVTTRGDFLRQFPGQKRTELPPNGLLARHPKQLLHARVPGFDDALQIHGKHTNVEGFHDVFAEILEASDFQRFLFQRAVKLGVVERDSDVASDGYNQFDIVAGQEVTVDGLPQAQNRNGMFPNTARNKVVQVELLAPAAHGSTVVLGRTGRLKEEGAAGSLEPRRLDETPIQGCR